MYYLCFVLWLFICIIALCPVRLYLFCFDRLFTFFPVFFFLCFFVFWEMGTFPTVRGDACKSGHKVKNKKYNVAKVTTVLRGIVGKKRKELRGSVLLGSKHEFGS